jgi:methionyl-tRNA formyltransferase
MRVICFGTLGEFSRTPFVALLEAGIDVCGVVVPATPSSVLESIAPLMPFHQSPLPIVNPFAEHSLVHLAWERQIPVYEVKGLTAPKTLATISFLQPDVACSVCFPKRIPAAVLRLPRFGFLNLHPSLLPHYRGPYPLFWMFRNGEAQTGVTIHFMDEEFDTGDIVVQAPLDFPDGISGDEADRLCATLGGQLMVDVIHALERSPVLRRQQPADGSYYPSPRDDDFSLGPSWPARRAFNFMRATREWGHRYPIEIGSERFALRQALAFSIDGQLDQPYVLSGDELAIQFTPGVLRAKL